MEFSLLINLLLLYKFSITLSFSSLIILLLNNLILLLLIYYVINLLLINLIVYSLD